MVRCATSIESRYWLGVHRKLDGPESLRHACGFGYVRFAADVETHAGITLTLQNVVRWMRRIPEIIRAKEKTGGLVKALYGVTCDDIVQLSDTIALYPIQKLPSSRVTTHLLATHERAMDTSSSPIAMGLIFPPRAALFRAGSFEAMRAAGSQWIEELNTAASLLAIVPNAAPLEAAHWFHFDDSDVDLLHQPGLSAQLSEFLHSRRLMEPANVTVAAMGGVFGNYVALKKKDRDRITLALDRVIRSRCQFIPGNRAIDLAIALEVLFMNTERDEHSYKISIRAARLLRSTLHERRVTFDEIRRIYEIRSGMVHTGSAANEYTVAGEAKKRTATELVTAADIACTQAIREFLSAGKIPESWRDIELG